MKTNAPPASTTTCVRGELRGRINHAKGHKALIARPKRREARAERGFRRFWSNIRAPSGPERDGKRVGAQVQGCWLVQDPQLQPVWVQAREQQAHLQGRGDLIRASPRDKRKKEVIVKREQPGGRCLFSRNSLAARLRFFEMVSY
jgi:hypothetical protein